MENVWHLVVLSLGLLFLKLCGGFPIDLESADLHNATIWTTLTPLLAVAFLVTSVLFILGCVCCRQNKGFQEFTDSTSSHSLSAAGGFVNSAASTTEFTIFPPAQAATATLAAPPASRLSVPGDRSSVVRFEPLPDIRMPQPHGIRPAAFNNAVSHGLSSQDWFQDPHVNFPRQKLKYLRELGRGWFGRVVEGEAQNIEPEQKTSKVVVKILHEDATTTDQMYFLHEVKPYRELSHPNILNLLGRCLETDPFLVLLEACPSGDLKSFLSQNIATAEALSQQGVTLRMCCNIASGLLHMHDNGFVHTDLAARNCLVTPDLTVKIGDYGTSIETFKEDYYCAGEVALPIRWCAPETLHCTETTIETKEVTMSANVWSLGVVLWEICEFGKLPYSEHSDDEVIVKVLGEGKHRLGLPSLSCPQRQNLYLLMKLCWHSLPERPLLLQVHSMLNHLHSSRERYSQDGDNSSLKTDEDFERRWEMFKPNTIPKTDNHITSSSETTPVVQSPTHSVVESPMRNTLSDVTATHLEALDETLHPKSLILQPAAFESIISSRDSGNLTVDGSSTTPLTTSPQPSLASSSGGEFFIPTLQQRHKSPSLQNLRGSIDDLSEVANVPVWQKTGESDDLDHTSDIMEEKEGEAGELEEIKEKETEEVISLEPDFDSWLKGVETTNEEDAKFVRKISEAIRDLDNALALEKTSSSSSEASSKSVSHQSPVKDTAIVLSEQNVVLDFRLGRADSGVSSDDKEMMFQPDSLQDDSFIEHAKSVHMENRGTDSGTDTEDETWRRRIERGEFSEKVKEKSKSVADLMVLTHIECSDGSDSDPPSLTWSFECSSNGRSSFTTRLRPGSFNKNAAVVCNSESNIHGAVLGEDFKDTLKKLHEAQRENKTLKPEPLLLNLLSEDKEFSSHSNNHEKDENFLANDASEEFTKQEGEGMATCNIEILTKYAITKEKSLQNYNVAGSSDVAQESVGNIIDALAKDMQSSSNQVPEEDSACSSASISNSQDEKDCKSLDLVSVLACVDSSMSEVLDDNVPHIHVIESSLHSVVKDISSDNYDVSGVSLLASGNLNMSETAEDSSMALTSRPLFTSTPHCSQNKEEYIEPVHSSAIRRLDYCETMPISSSVSSLSPSRTYSSDTSVEPLETSYNESISSSNVLSDSFHFSPADKIVNKTENLSESSPETSGILNSSSQENVPLAPKEAKLPAPLSEIDNRECHESVASNLIPSVVLGPCEEYTLDYFKGLKTTSGGEFENFILPHSEDISYIGKDGVPEDNQQKPVFDYCIASWEKHLSSSFKEHEAEVGLFDIGCKSGADSLSDQNQLTGKNHVSTDNSDANIDQDSLNLELGNMNDTNLSNLSIDHEFVKDSSQNLLLHDSNAVVQDVFDLFEEPNTDLVNETLASTSEEDIEQKNSTIDSEQEITIFSPIKHSSSDVQETGMLNSEKNYSILTTDTLPMVNEKLMLSGLCIPSLNFIAATPIPSGRNSPEMYAEESVVTPHIKKTDACNENVIEIILTDICKDNIKEEENDYVKSKTSKTSEESSVKVTVDDELALTNTMKPDLIIVPNVSDHADKNSIFEACPDLELDDVVINLKENMPDLGIDVIPKNVNMIMGVSEIQSSLDDSEKINNLIGVLKQVQDLDDTSRKDNTEIDTICKKPKHCTNISSSLNSLYDTKEKAEIRTSNKIEEIPLEERTYSSDIIVKTDDCFKAPKFLNKSKNVGISEMSEERITNIACSPKDSEKAANTTLNIFTVPDNRDNANNGGISDVLEEMLNGVNKGKTPIMSEIAVTTDDTSVLLSSLSSKSESFSIQHKIDETNNNKTSLDKPQDVIGTTSVSESSPKDTNNFEIPPVQLETVNTNKKTHVTNTSEEFVNSTEIIHKSNSLSVLSLSDKVPDNSTKLEKVPYGDSDKLENKDPFLQLTEIVHNENVNVKDNHVLIDNCGDVEKVVLLEKTHIIKASDSLSEGSTETIMNNNSLISTSQTFHKVTSEDSSADLEKAEIQTKTSSLSIDSKKSVPCHSLKCHQFAENEENSSQSNILQHFLSPESSICKTQDFLDNERNFKTVNIQSDNSHIKTALCKDEQSAVNETNTSHVVECHQSSSVSLVYEGGRNGNSVKDVVCKKKISKEDYLLSSVELCDPLYMKHSRQLFDDEEIWLSHAKYDQLKSYCDNQKLDACSPTNNGDLTNENTSVTRDVSGKQSSLAQNINKLEEGSNNHVNPKQISDESRIPCGNSVGSIGVKPDFTHIDLQNIKFESDAIALSVTESYDLPLEIIAPKLQENEKSVLNPINELTAEEPIEIKLLKPTDLARIPDKKINDSSGLDFFNYNQDILGPNKGMHFHSQENKISPNSDILSYEQIPVDLDLKHSVDVFNEKEASRVSAVIDSWKHNQFDSNSRTLMEDFLLGERLASGLSASGLEIKAEELPETYETNVEAEDDSEDFGLDVVKHSTPDDERSSDSGFRDKGSLSESCEDACDEKYNLEDIEAELEETFNKGGFTYVEKHDDNDHSEHVHEEMQRKLSTRSSDDSALNYIEKTEEEGQRGLIPGSSSDLADNKGFFENGHDQTLEIPEDNVKTRSTVETSKEIETIGEATLLEEAIDEDQLKQMLGITDGVNTSAAFLKIECGKEGHYMSPEFFQQEDLISQTFENSKPDSLNLSDDSIESVLLVQSPTDNQENPFTKFSNVSAPCETNTPLDFGSSGHKHGVVEKITENISTELMDKPLEGESVMVETVIDTQLSDNSGNISPEKTSQTVIDMAKIEATGMETIHAEDISESGVESESESRDIQREAASTPINGWYLHPPPKSGSCDSGVNYSEEDERSNANAEDYPSPTNSGSCSSKIDDSNNSENSYVSFSLDEEFVTAIRNELREKLPCTSQQSQEDDSEDDEILDPDDELSGEDRTDIMIHYNAYPAPLSPILEERESVSSITTTLSEHYSPFASSNQRDVTKSGSDSEPVSPVFVLDSKDDSRAKYEVDAKKFEQEIREALENCSFSSSEESGSSCDKNRKAASVLFEDLEQQPIEDAQKLLTDVTVNGKNVVVVRGTNQHPEDDDLLVVNTETNEATLLESPKPKSHLAFVNSKKALLDNKICIDDPSATPDFFSDDEMAIGVNSDTFVIECNRFEETFEKNSEMSRMKETSSDDEVYTPDSISPEGATGTPSASSLQSPDTENLSDFFLTPSEKSPTSSDYPNSPPGPQNSAVYNPYFLHTLANNDDNPTYENVEEIHLVANNEAEEIISELENSGIINTNNNRAEKELLFSDLKTGSQEVLSSRASSAIDNSDVMSMEESSESMNKDMEENGNSVGRVKQLSAVDRLEYLTSPNLDVFAMKADGSTESLDSREEEENALNGNSYSRRLLLNNTLDLFKKEKDDIEEEKDWSLPNLEAAMLSTKAPMPSPEEESWKQIPSMLAFSDLNEVMARCGNGSNNCIPYGGQADVDEGDLMSTSFSIKGDPEDQECYTPDWESDSDETNEEDNNSSSSGEFIWKEGDRESSVKAVDISASSNTSKPYEGLSDFPMEAIAEEDEEDDDDDDDDADGSSSSGSGTEFVPSAWNSEATPNRSALRSPDKKSDQKKNVSFKKQKYHCVYEYPRETSDSDSEGFDSPTRRHWNNLVYQQPQVDYSSFADWELMDGEVLPDGSGNDTDTDPDVPESTPQQQQQLDFYKLSSVDYDFGNGMMSEDGEFYISSSARPFQFSSGNNDVLSNGSQFFPGQLYHMNDCKPVDFITPDSGIIDVTSADKFSNLEAGVDSCEDEVDTSPSSISRFAVSFNDHLLSRKSNSIKDIAWEDEVDSGSPDINQTSSNVASTACSEVGEEKTSVNSVKVQESTIAEVVSQTKVSDANADRPVSQSPVSSYSKSHPSSTDSSKDKDGETASQSPSSPLSPSGLGELRHTRDRLKLDLPTSSKAFVLDPPAVGKRRSVETVKGEASVLDSGEETEDSGIESSNGAATSLKIASEDTSKS